MVFGSDGGTAKPGNRSRLVRGPAGGLGSRFYAHEGPDAGGGAHYPSERAFYLYG